MTIRVFLGLQEIAGYNANLKKGFQQLGYNCTFINLSDHPFDYGGDDTCWLVHILKNLLRKKSATPRINIGFIIILKLLILAFKVMLFVWVLFKHDAFIFIYKSTFFNYYELPVLKFFNKIIIYKFVGSDLRPPYINGSFVAASRALNIEDCVKQAQKTKNTIKRIEKYATYIISSPSYAHFTERPFILGLIAGLPYTKQCFNLNFLEITDKVRILHSPSFPEAKGSIIIRDAISRLKNKGLRIDYVELTGKSNNIVHEELQKCDFVVDQLYSDTPMAGFATEAALYGKPSVVGGYYSSFIGKDIDPVYIPPSVYCNPEDIESAIERLVDDKNYRLDLGKKAQMFVKNNWHPIAVAEKYLRIIQCDVPACWLYNPNKIKYPYGCGINKDKVKELIRAIVCKYGKGALQLYDKPDLEELMLNFAYDKDRDLCSESL